MGDMEYKTVPMPTEPRKYKGLKKPVDRVSRTLTEILNEEARGGWTFVRSEKVELEVRKGILRSMDEVEVTLLVFARQRSDSARMTPARQEPILLDDERPPLSATD